MKRERTQLQPTDPRYDFGFAMSCAASFAARVVAGEDSL